MMCVFVIGTFPPPGGREMMVAETAQVEDGVGRMDSGGLKYNLKRNGEHSDGAHSLSSLLGAAIFLRRGGRVLHRRRVGTS